MTRLQVPTLAGVSVILEPLSTAHLDGIVAAGSGDRGTFGLTHVPDGADAARSYVGVILDDAAAGLVAPFAQRRVADGIIVGCTRFLDPQWPLGRQDPDEIEIGGTWLTPSAQRTAINTESKLLMLTHAFDVWAVQRVAICTDARNAQSRRAIERLGARFEGILRRHRRSAVPEEHGLLRDTAYYSITVDGWPDVRASLTRRLEQH